MKLRSLRLLRPNHRLLPKSTQARKLAQQELPQAGKIAHYRDQEDEAEWPQADQVSPLRETPRNGHADTGFDFEQLSIAGDARQNRVLR